MIAKVFSSFVKGRAAMLDDRGKLIEQMSGRTSSEFTLSPLRTTLQQPMSFYKKISELLPIITFVVCGVIFIAGIGAMLWKLAEFISGLIFSNTGYSSTLPVFISIFLLVISIWFIANRWSKARDDVHARHGKREVRVLLDMLNAIHYYHRCPACGFSLAELIPEPDGCSVCPECSGAWNRLWWADFIPAASLGELANKPDKKREKRCLNDARTAEFEVAAWLPRKERRAYFRLSKTKISASARIKLSAVLIFLIITTGIPLALIHSTYAPWTIGTAIVLFAIGFAIFNTIYGVCQRQQFVRDQIDLGRCAQCNHELNDTPHPIDGALCCPQCRHAWDPDTAHKKHHARKRFKPNDYRHGFPESADAPSQDERRPLASGDEEPRPGFENL